LTGGRTIRNVALAALLILLVTPESLFDPNFRISFAAVVGLVALVEANSKRPEDQARDVSFLWGFAQAPGDRRHRRGHHARRHGRRAPSPSITFTACSITA
jgi:competence protein ComEC